MTELYSPTLAALPLLLVEDAARAGAGPRRRRGCPSRRSRTRILFRFAAAGSSSSTAGRGSASSLRRLLDSAITSRSTSTISDAASRSIRSRRWSIIVRRAAPGRSARGHCRERVARYPKAWIRRRLIGRLREAVTAAGGIWIRMAPFPYPYRSAFSFRADLDESVPEDYHRFAAARAPLASCSHSLSEHATPTPITPMF